jgi:hypothetical protein
MLLAAASIPVVVGAVRSRSRGSPAFAEPLIGLGTVVMPGLSLIGLVTQRIDQPTTLVTIACLVITFMILLVHAGSRGPELSDDEARESHQESH